MNMPTEKTLTLASPLSHRPTLGLLTTGFWHSLSFELWRGVYDAAKAHDVHLICFPGNELKSKVKQEESPENANVLYDLVGAQRLDGLLIWAGALGNFVPVAELEEFCCSFKPLPTLCIGRKIKDLPYLDSDDVQSARAVIAHLIEVHGYRRIMFVRGPAGHASCEMRYQAYLDTLAAYGIPFDPNLVTPAMDGWGSIETQYRPYLDGQVAHNIRVDKLPLEQWPCEDDPDSTEFLHVLYRRRLMPGRDFDAFVGATDVITALAIRRLQSVGIHVPKDVAATGGDGSQEANHVLQMRLTSTDLMLYQQGYRAVEMLLTAWQGQPVSDERIVSAQLTITPSCGCLSDAIQQAGGPRFDAAPDTQEIIRALRDSMRAIQSRLPPDWAELVWGACVVDVQSDTPSQLLPVLSMLAPIVFTETGSAGAWQTTLSVLREAILAFLHPDCARSADTLLHKARLLISELEREQTTFMELRRERQSALLFEVSQALGTKFDIQELLDALLTELPRIGVRAFYLSLYDNSLEPSAGLRLILAFDENGPIALPLAGRRFPAEQIVPDDLLSHAAPYALVVEPLYFQQAQIGVAVFRAEPGIAGQVYQTLRAQISSALKGSLLVAQVQEDAEDLQRANAQIQALNEQLKDENIRMRTEMDLARRIQTSLLPQSVQHLHPDFEIAAAMLPAEQVGGDYYDITLDREGALWFGIGDVSGHGVTPGLIMMMAQTVHTTITANYHATPREIIIMINNVLRKNVSERLREDHFMTFTTLKYLGEGHFQHAGAHVELIIYRQRTGACEVIETAGTWLNLMPDIAEATGEAEFTLEVGDTLILHTDGLTEAWNTRKEIFGLPRLLDIIQTHAAEPPEQLREAIIDAALRWCHDRQEDDISLVVARRIQ